MNMVEQVKAGGRYYNVTRATAVNQKSLLLLVGTRVSMNSAMSGSEINTAFLKGLLLALPEPDFDKVVSIVLFKTVEHGGDVPVTLDTFQHGMNEFLTLVAEAVKLNLSDFFGWLDSENESAKTSNEVYQPKPTPRR